MTKTDGRRSAQGERTKPSFEYKPVPNDEENAGQSDKDLGARWGLGENSGPRKARRRPSPDFPGGLGTETVPDGTESRRESLDQPDLGIDRPPESRLDQAAQASDRQGGLDQPRPSGSDRHRDSLDQSQPRDVDRQEELSQERASTDRQEEGSGSRIDPEGAQENPAYDSDELEYAESQGDRGGPEDQSTDGEKGNSDGSNTIGPSNPRFVWKKVFRKSSKGSEKSDDSRDVEDLLDRPTSRDGSKYFPKEFYGSDEDEEPEPDEPESEPSLDTQLRRQAAMMSGRSGKNNPKKNPKGKQPIRPEGYDEFMSSISQAGAKYERNRAAEALGAISAKHDRRNVPSGVHFNRTKGITSEGSARAKKKPARNEGGSTKPKEKTKGRAKKIRIPTPMRSRKSLPSTSSDSSESSATSSSDPSTDSTSSESSDSPDSLDSEETSSTSSESSSSNDRRKRSKKSKKRSASKKKRSKKKRRDERILKRVKIDAPSPYNGKADLDAFDRWAYEVSTWKRLNRMSEGLAVTMLNKYVTDKAGIFYMKYVAGKERRWTMTTIFEGLFDYCFPKDFKLNLRRRLMNATQGKARITEFVRDIELMAGRFPDINERGLIEIFWWGIHQPIRVKVLKMGAHPERSTMHKMVDCAIRAEDGIIEANLMRNREGRPTGDRTWGRFANRTSGPKPYRPQREDDRQDRTEMKEHVRANAVTPQPRAGPSAGPSRPERGNTRQRQATKGRKISREKRDQLRAEGKCFQCEQPGHSQRDCPQLNTMKPPTVRANNIDVARLERLSRAKDKADLQVGHISVKLEQVDDDATPTMHLVYRQCAAIWGEDERWLDPETRYKSNYGIHQYGTGVGDLVEIVVRDRPEMGPIEVSVHRFNDPDFVLTDLLNLDANARPCVHEGGFRDRKTYNIWKWSALSWLKELVRDQLTLEKSEEKVTVGISFGGYGLHIEGTDVHFEVSHAEVLGDALNIGRVLDVMHSVKEIDARGRSPIFWDTRLNKRQRRMLRTSGLSVGSVRLRKPKTEGVHSIEKTTM